MSKIVVAGGTDILRGERSNARPAGDTGRPTRHSVAANR